MNIEEGFSYILITNPIKRNTNINKNVVKYEKRCYENTWQFHHILWFKTMFSFVFIIFYDSKSRVFLLPSYLMIQIHVIFVFIMSYDSNSCLFCFHHILWFKIMYIFVSSDFTIQDHVCFLLSSYFMIQHHIYSYFHHIIWFKTMCILAFIVFYGSKSCSCLLPSYFMIQNHV